MVIGSIFSPMKHRLFLGALVLGAWVLGLRGTWGQVDDEFWFVAPEVTSLHGDSPVLLRFATFDVPANVVVDMPANSNYLPINVTIPANSAVSIDLTDSLSWYENQPFDEVLDKGIHITSTADISAYYEVNRINNPDIFALKGDNALGTSFHLPFQNFTSNGYTSSPAGFDVVATEDNTVITITPTQDLQGHPAGISYDVVLPFAGSTYSGRAAGTSAAAHPTGTTITASAPVAVTLSDDSCNGTIFGGCADLMGDQLVPDNILGTEYIAVHGYLAGDDRIQILATEDNTTVTVDGALLATLQAGEAYQHVLNTPSAFIETSAPAAVWQSTGFGCELGGAQLPSVKCTGSNATVFVRSTSETMRFNLLVPAGGEGDFLFNGTSGIVTANMFAVVPGNPNWMFAQVTTLEGVIPVGGATRIENTSHVFHMGIINGGASSGTRYGYFSDYGALQYQAVNQSLDPCVGDPLVLEVLPVENGLYQWSGPNNFSSTGLSVNLGYATENVAGNYVIQGYTGECEIQNDTIEVVVHEPLGPPTLSGDLAACLGQTITFSASSTTTMWTGPDGFNTTGEFVVLQNIGLQDAGVYVATLPDPYCPAMADSLTVTVYTPEDLAMDWEDEREICFGEQTWVNLPSELAVENPTVEWWFVDESGGDPVLISTEASLLVNTPGLYFAESTTPPPCEATSTGEIVVLRAECDLIIPNVITPGNDDVNNRFFVPNLAQFPGSSVRIYNRWGQTVFQHDDFGSTVGWLPDPDVSEGVYYYVMNIAHTNEAVRITTELGVTELTEYGPVEVHGSFMLFKGP